VPIFKITNITIYLNNFIQGTYLDNSSPDKNPYLEDQQSHHNPCPTPFSTIKFLMTLKDEFNYCSSEYAY
jgi:hypothetical protein